MNDILPIMLFMVLVANSLFNVSPLEFMVILICIVTGHSFWLVIRVHVINCIVLGVLHCGLYRRTTQSGIYMYSTIFTDRKFVTKLTMSSLALSIFRTNFYDPSTFPIHIPNQNEDTFIRRGYYGGHADTYIPKGDNLNYYDVNSLYPFIMKTFSMPGGKPVWHGNLEKKNQYDILENMYGFFEAHIVCPISIKRPFLPSQFINKLISYSSYQYVSKGIL